MNATEQRAFVCGFGDPAAGVGGLAWDLGEPGALLLTEGEVSAATFALEEGGDAATLEITAGEMTVKATVTPRTAEIPLGDAAVSPSSSAPLRWTAGTARRASSAPARSAAGAPIRSRARGPSATWRSTRATNRCWWSIPAGSRAPNTARSGRPPG